MKFIILALYLTFAKADIFTPPGCITNYTTFMDQQMNYSSDDLIITYNSINADTCANYCNYNESCVGFNYQPNIVSKNYTSSCNLLDISFNQTHLNKSFDNAFYLKSLNDCSIENHMYLILYISLGLIGLLLICCCMCHCCKRRRNNYNRI